MTPVKEIISIQYKEIKNMKHQTTYLDRTSSLIPVPHNLLMLTDNLLQIIMKKQLKYSVYEVVHCHLFLCFFFQSVWCFMFAWHNSICCLSILSCWMWQTAYTVHICTYQIHQRLVELFVTKKSGNVILLMSQLDSNFICTTGML